MRLVDANFVQQIADKELNANDVQIIQYILSHTPTIEAAPVRHGKWMQDKAARIQYRYNCSECGSPIYDKIRPYKYCPNCGAEMER